ncbi:carboxypeptidase regulatory-like domain-containing protein [Terrabacter sp. 2RAF25]|uniref:carboxypeptidase regulatory-like domain-containing protein n=1 Tax=Terrabacter sp. 2RAF25 TaxID=3232998 RepID=UPI003F9C890F
MSSPETHPDLHPEDLELLDRLARIAAAVDPVPDEVLELGRAAFDLHRADTLLMSLVTDAGAAVRDNGSATASHIVVFELGEISVELEVARRGEFARVIGVVMAGDRPYAAECRVSLETSASSTTQALDAGRFAFERVPVGLARLVLDRGDEQPMRTPWFDCR